MPSKGSIAALIFGSVSLLSLISWWYFYIYNRSGVKAIANVPHTSTVTAARRAAKGDEEEEEEEEDDEEEDDEDEDEEEEDEGVEDNLEPPSNSNHHSTSSTTTSQHHSHVTVEDVSDDEDEQGGGQATTASAGPSPAEAARQAQEKADQLAAKQQYDDAVRQGSKRMQGNQFVAAAQKFKEAIDLTAKVKVHPKDLVTLYNNCSAMYEKAGEFEEALVYINVVLAMDNRHIKARVRRARVFEAQGRLTEALNEYVVAMLIEQQSGSEPGNVAVIDSLSKTVAAAEAKVLVNKVRASSQPRAYPSQAHCKSFLDSFPGFYEWTDRLQNASRPVISDDEEEVSPLTKLSVLLDQAYWDAVHGSVHQALRLISSTEAAALASALSSSSSSSSSSEDPAVGSVLSRYNELLGTHCNLSCLYTQAQACYAEAMRLDTNNVEAALKLAHLHCELGDVDDAAALLGSVQTALVAQGVSADTADGLSEQALAPLVWVTAHMSWLWTIRNENGKFKPNTIENSLEDLNKAIALSSKVRGASSGSIKGARFSALLKKYYTLAQTKPQTGLPTTDEDRLEMKECLRLARDLFPSHPSIALLEADLAFNPEDMSSAETALLKADAAAKTAEPGNATPLLVKAGILTQTALTFAGMGDGPRFKATIEEVEKLFSAAIEMEPTSQEAYVNFAQMKNFMGDVASGLQLLEKAIPLVRGMDDAQELCQMTVMGRAQMAAILAIQAM